MVSTLAHDNPTAGIAIPIPTVVYGTPDSTARLVDIIFCIGIRVVDPYQALINLTRVLNVNQYQIPTKLTRF